MRIGFFLKYDREVVKWSENWEIPDLWGRVDRYVAESLIIKYFGVKALSHNKHDTPFNFYVKLILIGMNGYSFRGSNSTIFTFASLLNGVNSLRKEFAP